MEKKSELSLNCDFVKIPSVIKLLHVIRIVLEQKKSDTNEAKCLLRWCSFSFVYATKM